jgi:UDP-3-O-[3-hydroxymyristoyl] glucosamine N-acyltransferase
MVAGGSGVHNSQPKGAVVGGLPAIPVRKWAKACAVFSRLPEIYSDLRRMKKEIAALGENNKK